MSLTRSLTDLLRGPRGDAPPISTVGDFASTDVDAYWNEYTVDAPRFRTPAKSEQHLRWRAGLYPLFEEFMGLWGTHDDEVILDYGCGPGNDVVGFLLYTQARKVIGIDVSKKALGFAQDRLALHGIAPERVELMLTGDSSDEIPLEDESIDYINCSGVLHHVSHPESYIAEFHRVLRPGSSARIMVYNHDSVWFHLYTAYRRMIVDGDYAGLAVEEAFARTVDGEECPVARPNRAAEFSAMCSAAGFQTTYLGGYLSQIELDTMKEHADAARADERLAPVHREFLEALVRDDAGLPVYEGKHAGIGGVYELRKPH